jgi:hypothetical protein
MSQTCPVNCLCSRCLPARVERSVKAGREALDKAITDRGGVEVMPTVLTVDWRK